METKIQQFCTGAIGSALVILVIVLIGYAAQEPYQGPVNRPAPTTTQEHVYYHEA